MSSTSATPNPSTITIPPSLSTLPIEILYTLFRRLDRPAKLLLGLTGPLFLHRLARYYDLERYRSQLALPAHISFNDPAAQGAIIRFLCASGGDDIDDPVEEELKDELAPYMDIMLDSTRPPRPLPYEQTEEGKEDALVNAIMSSWMARKFGTRGGVILCADCSRFMVVFARDGRVTDWANDMLGRQRWFRHCGPCENKYGIPRGTVIV